MTRLSSEQSLSEWQKWARVQAQNTLTTYWDEDRFPVDPYRIADELDIDVWLSDLGEDISGIFRKKPDAKPEIYIDRMDGGRRQRFTCAHEIGHYMHLRLEGKMSSADDEVFIERRDVVSSHGSEPQEVFANEFAANLLMPAVTVRALRKRGMDTYDLARFFDVSPTSMEFRLTNLGLAR